MNSLTSPQNPLIKAVRRAVRAGALTEDGFAVTEGFHLLEEALRSGREVAAVFATESAVDRLPPLGALHTVPDHIFAQISSTETPQGVVALVRPAAWTIDEALAGESLVVVLDGIQEPGNAGAIVRAAEAFGATGAVFLKGSVNPYNPKCLRASAGSLFRVPMVYGVDDASFWGAAQRLKVYAAMPQASASLEHADLTGPCAFLMGSEGHGVRPEAARRATGLRIPTTGVESLNAAVAAGILLYEARRQRMRQP